MVRTFFSGQAISMQTLLTGIHRIFTTSEEPSMPFPGCFTGIYLNHILSDFSEKLDKC